jgi:hypothetical protein
LLAHQLLAISLSHTVGSIVDDQGNLLIHAN